MIGIKAQQPARRGRPRSFDRQDALCAALRVFRERGYEGTSMADLQEALGGLSPPSLYAAFGSKEALFMEAVELYTGQIRASAARALAAAPTTKAKVEALLRSAVLATTEPGEPRGCLLVQGAIACSPSSDNVQRYLHELRAKAHRTVSKCLKDGLAGGDLPERTDIAGLASFYTTLIHGLAIQARDGASRASMMATVDRAMTAWNVFVASRAP